MTKSARYGLIAMVVCLLVTISFVQRPIDRLRPQFVSGSSGKTARETSLLFDLSLQYAGAAAMGLREAVASMLWLRADGFFHEGNYEAVIPLVRLITMLDPHQIEVYSTGAWMLDFNFTDTDQRSDRRYIPPAISLLREGIKNNPDRYDLYFELGWTHYYMKIKDYEGARYWLEKAVTKPGKDDNTGKTIDRPPFTDRMLAHVYEQTRDYDKAEAQWRKCIAQSEKAEKKETERSFDSEIGVAKRNLGLFLLRRAWRMGDMGAYKRGIEELKAVQKGDPILTQALVDAEKNYNELLARSAAPHDTQPPIDAMFSVSWKKVKPKVLLIEGGANLIKSEAYAAMDSEAFTHWYEINQSLPADRRENYRNGCRVRIVLSDITYDYWKMNVGDEFQWEIDPKQTIMMADYMISDGKFKATIDMSKDPAMYPFVRDEYRLSVWFNPQLAPDFIQDRIGWEGEGMTDRNYLDTTTHPGYRMLRKDFILKKSDII